VTNDRGTDLRYYGRALLRRKWIIGLITAALAAAALGGSLAQDHVYRASTQLLIQTDRSPSLFDPATGIGTSDRSLQTQIGVLMSPVIRDAVMAEVPGAPTITAAASGPTDIVLVSAESTDPRLAARTTDAYARAYIDYRRRQAVDSLLAAGREIQKKIDGIDAEIKDVNAQLEGLKGRPQDVESGSLTGRRDSLIAQQALFRQRLDQLQVDAGLQNTQSQLVGPATVPTHPIRPTPVRTTVLALIAGLIVGAAIALLRDRLDETLKTKDDIERAAPGLPVLAVVPTAAGGSERGHGETVSTQHPTSASAEAYRTLRTAIQFLAVHREIGVIQLTSPDAAEGKSTTVANLAVAMARSGKRVLVACCDLRRPTIHEFFGLDNTVGLTSVLLNEVSLADALKEVDGEPNILVLCAGPPAPNPSELLSSRATMTVLEQLKLKAICDVLLVDCPPVLPVTDAAIMSAYVDGTVVVASARETTQARLREAVELLRQVEAPLLGIVLNGVPAPSRYDDYSYEPIAPPVSRRPKHRWRRAAPSGKQARISSPSG